MHVHSFHSDGQLSPEALVQLGIRSGLWAMVLCDHDTVKGTRDFLRAAEARGMKSIPGVELSTQLSGVSSRSGDKLDQDEVHLLGYGVRPDDPAFQTFIERNQEHRRRRMRLMIERLQGLGLSIDEPEVQEVAADASSLGRPHAAKVLVQKGYARDVPEVFDTYLGVGRPGYVPRRRNTLEEAVEAVYSAGGLPVLAHPGCHRDPLEVAGRAAALGIAGIEVIHRDHSFSVIYQLIRFARKRDLLCTGGSDFHGYGAEPDLGDLYAPGAWFCSLTDDGKTDE